MLEIVPHFVNVYWKSALNIIMYVPSLDLKSSSCFNLQQIKKQVFHGPRNLQPTITNIFLDKLSLKICKFYQPNNCTSGIPYKMSKAKNGV